MLILCSVANIHESICMYEHMYVMSVCILANMLWVCMYVCMYKCMYWHKYVGIQVFIYADRFT